MKKTVLSTILAVMTLGLIACSKTENEEISSELNEQESVSVEEETTENVTEEVVLPEVTTLTIKVWVPWNEVDSGWIDKRCEDFKALHPEWDLTFVTEVKEIMDAPKDVKADPANGAAVYAFRYEELSDLISDKNIVPYSSESANIIKNDNLENLVNTVTVDDSVYGAVYTSNTWFMYYDKRVYTEEDVKSLDAMMEKSPVSFPLNNAWYMYSFYEGNGCSLHGGVNNPKLGMDISGQKAVDVTKYLLDKVKSNKLILDDSAGNTWKKFVDGSVKAMFSGSWDHMLIDSLGENLGIAQLPTYNLNGKEIQMYSFMGSRAFGLNPHSEAYKLNSKIVEEFALFLCNPESQLTRYEMARVIPASKELVESEKMLSDELVQAQNNTIKNTTILQPSNKYFNNRYWTYMAEFLDHFNNGGIDDSNIETRIEELNEALNRGY
ncbi:MAG: extracellular solute-binding protein [Lachnospiraceae bacterium]|nr:extracellular solute-binding protein [Lachnospiraceae bacterium]